MKITILGCGPSGGVPLVGGVWGNCDPAEPKNYRTRSSLLIETAGHNLLIDTSPDLRAQLLREAIKTIDGVFFTHAHADHCHGIDDLRPIYIAHKRATIPIYGAQETMEALHNIFGYLFHSAHAQYPQVLNPNALPMNTDIDMYGMKLRLFEQDHGFSTTTGYRFNDVAYSTDVLNLDETAFAQLQDLDLWIVDCLAEQAKPTHSHLAQTLEWIERVKPRRAILTHMDQSLDYHTLKAQLPSHIEPAYDGMVINLS